MAYRFLGAADVLAAGLQALPPCYDRELDECIQGRPSKIPGCAAINAAYDSSKENFAKMEDVVDAMPFCAPGTAAERVWVIAGAAALGGAVLGVMLSR